MATSIREFNVGLHREHLEEASFLYEQRLEYLHDPEVTWRSIRDWEDRFEAHIDALVLGGDLALDICRQRTIEGDAGELHAALCVLCRHDRKQEAFALVGALDPAAEDAVRAGTQALCRELPAGWRDHLLVEFQRDQRLTALFAQVIGYRRVPAEGLLMRKLAETPAAGRAELAWALGRVGTASSVPALWPLVGQDDQRVCEAAAIALMRLGDRRILQHAVPVAQQHSWARRVLGIGGNSSAVRALLAIANQRPAKDTVLALGLLGDLAAVVPLINLLEDDESAEAAAIALNTITGAQLYARVFVPDSFDIDELNEEEREAHEKDGSLPTRLGEPYGNWERRALLDRKKWLAWLDQNKHRFSRECRWRMGKPHGPAALLECLRSEANPYAVRAATYEEFVVRFGLEVPFEVDLPVSLQRSLLGRMEQWVAGHSREFVEGRWHFGGELQD